MNLEADDELSFFNLVELLTKLGYVESFDEEEKLLLASLWSNLSTTDEENSEPGITQSNVSVFLAAVDNLWVESMRAPPIGSYKEER